MKRTIQRLTFSITLAASLFTASAATEQSQSAPKPTYVRLGAGVPGLLYDPSISGSKSQIGIFVMHASGDYLTFSACTELSKRGYRVLCANNSTSKSGAADEGVIDKVLLEAKAGVAYLRQLPGIQKVILFGHSGGATIMTAYQLIAENGVKACQGAEKIHKCPDTLANLPRADGMVLPDANWGQSTMTLFSIDPAVIGQDSGMTLNPALDMFNPANGFKPDGSSYSATFIRNFLAAVGKRNNDLIKGAQARLAAIEAGKGLYVDDEPFTIPGANLLIWNNRLFSQDIRLLSHSRRPWPLIRADGTALTQIIQSLRKPQNTENFSSSMMRGALKTTVRGFLSSYAIRVNSDFSYNESAIQGIDWTSSYSNPPGNVQGITVPLLTLGMTGGWEGLAAETIYDYAKSADKSIAFIEGATHVYTPCTKCETIPGQFGDTVKTTYDTIDGWLGKAGRFLN